MSKMLRLFSLWCIKYLFFWFYRSIGFKEILLLLYFTHHKETSVTLGLLKHCTYFYIILTRVMFLFLNIITIVIIIIIIITITIIIIIIIIIIKATAPLVKQIAKQATEPPNDEDVTGTQRCARQENADSVRGCHM